MDWMRYSETDGPNLIKIRVIVIGVVVIFLTLLAVLSYFLYILIEKENRKKSQADLPVLKPGLRLPPLPDHLRVKSSP